MASIVTAPASTTTNEKGNYTLPLIVLTTLFFMWGFITCLNDILIPYLQGIFKLTSFQAGLIQSAFFGAYFVISLVYFLISTSVGDPLAKIGYKNGIIIGLITAAIGCILFYPAAELKVFGIFMIALFVLASGITILQMSANPYVALLGSSETSSSRLNLTQAFNSLGTTIAPIIGGKLIFEAVGGKEHMTAEAVKSPYLFLGATLLIIAVIIGFSKLPRFTGETIEKGLGVLKFSHLTLGVIGIFMYVGGEVAIGTFLVRYFEALKGFDEATAAGYLSYFWGGAMVGRFIGAISLTNRSSVQKYSFRSV
jgi:MFS transporter, FHS family, L-fucose permease